jgi:nucleoid-associated protein YgaU
MDRHVVQDGENLSRIAEQYYGSSDPTILDAIVKANDETMSGPNHIISGQELLLPEIPGIESIRRAESAQWATSEADADPRQTYGDPKQTYGVDDKIESNERTTAEPKIVAEYEVQPGDLLSRVVSRHYGSASKQIVDAVYQANKTRMKSPDALVAGTVIVLPEIAGVRPNGLDEKSHQRDEPLAPSPSTQESFRWYVVKKGDTYSKIAAAEMGTSKRWEELAEFNKNVFAKATQIRHGVRIRIPTTTPSDDTTGSSRRGR